MALQGHALLKSLTSAAKEVAPQQLCLAVVRFADASSLAESQQCFAYRLPVLF